MASEETSSAVRIHHLLLHVANLEQSRLFYVERLGFTERTDAKPLPDGRKFVSLKQGLGLTQGVVAKPRQVDHMAFEVRNVEALNRVLKSAGVEFERELGAGPYGKAIYVKDPDGNILELFEIAG